jgi:hypothetical protein
VTAARTPLSDCDGFRVEATDGPCGVIDMPLFPPDGEEPDYLVVRTGSRLNPRYPVVPTELVDGVDRHARHVRLGVPATTVRRLPEHLPLAL